MNAKKSKKNRRTKIQITCGLLTIEGPVPAIYIMTGLLNYECLDLWLETEFI